MKRIRTWHLLLAAAAFGLAPVGGRADVQGIIRETQRIEQVRGGMRLIWWIPTDYWRESFKTSTISKAQADGIYKTLDEYIIIAIEEGKVGPAGGFTPLPRDEMLAKLSVKVGEGDDLKPVDPGDLSPDARNLLDMMKPVLSNMLGQFGKGIEFVCFPAKDASGAKLADPHQPGLLKVTYAGTLQQFRLPLGSLMPPKYDPKTGEQFMGNYTFSPYTGTRLVDAPPPAANP